MTSEKVTGKQEECDDLHRKGFKDSDRKGSRRIFKEGTIRADEEIIKVTSGNTFSVGWEIEVVVKKRVRDNGFKVFEQPIEMKLRTVVKVDLHINL